MTGMEHYAEAERLYQDAANASPNAALADVALLLQFAQVNATLALAAITAGASTLAGARHNDPGKPATPPTVWPNP